MLVRDSLPSTVYHRNDNIVELLWPKVMAIKKVLSSSADLVGEGNIALLKARLCSNQETSPDALTEFLKGADEPGKKLEGKNGQLVTMLNDLSLALSRMRPMTNRLGRVFEQSYIKVTAV